MVSFYEVDGVMVQGDRPNWEPLLAAVGEDVTSWFMWMFEVRTSDGRRLHDYKHIATRCYVHLDEGGSAFFYFGESDGGGRYRQIELWRLLQAALEPWWKEGLRDGDAADIAAAKRAIKAARSRSRTR